MVGWRKNGAENNQNLPFFPSRDYYVREELRFGPPYDLEVYGLEEAQERELEGGEGANTSIRQVSSKQSLTFGYDNLTVEHLDSTQHLLEQVTVDKFRLS